MEKLRARRLSVTPQRLAVLAVLQALSDHPTAERIYQEVRRQMPAISFNTVYKTLEVFCQKGLVTKVNPLHEMARYDKTTQNTRISSAGSATGSSTWPGIRHP